MGLGEERQHNFSEGRYGSRVLKNYDYYITWVWRVGTPSKLCKRRTKYTMLQSNRFGLC
jgi:hypothetical protein